MKKTLAAAITSALVIGVASTTFAAANPFSDVPRDHWSFDAVAKLAQEGVIEGYGDNTFRGDAHITRYEMAQMVAKAMAKDGLTGDAKSVLDKLSAEYADELNNLGVRVANLEERSDNVKITGLLRLEGYNKQTERAIKNDNVGTAKLRLDLDAKVNADWHVKGRLDANHSFNTDVSGAVTGVRAYAQGPLIGTDAKLGKFGMFDAQGLTVGGSIIDTEVTGAEFIFGNELKTTLTYGRINQLDYKINAQYPGTLQRAEIGGIQFAYDPTSALKLRAGYFNVNTVDDKAIYGAGETSDNIWEVGFDYKFTKDFTLGGMYAGSSVDSDELGFTNSDVEDTYAVQLTYKGAKASEVGSYGVWLAYRQYGTFATINPTTNTYGQEFGTKGYEVGVNYMIDKNILTRFTYFDGEKIEDAKRDFKKYGARVDFMF